MIANTDALFGVFHDLYFTHVRWWWDTMLPGQWHWRRPVEHVGVSGGPRRSELHGRLRLPWISESCSRPITRCDRSWGRNVRFRRWNNYWMIPLGISSTKWWYLGTAKDHFSLEFWSLMCALCGSREGGPSLPLFRDTHVSSLFRELHGIWHKFQTQWSPLFRCSGCASLKLWGTIL